MLNWPVDHVVTTGPIGLAARDYGGSGQPIVLLHGLGDSGRMWDAFAPLLTDQHRVIAYDQRGHGVSGDGPWDWDVALDDLDAIVEHFGLESPALIGHSLGGAIATRWGVQHPECAGVVNLDMIRGALTDLPNYVGMPAERARAERDRLTETIDSAGPYTPMHLTIRAALLADNMFALFRRIPCPLLVCVATRNLPEHGEFEELIAAYRKGIDRDIETIEDTNPRIRFTRVDASQLMVGEIPEELADLVRRFLATM